MPESARLSPAQPLRPGEAAERWGAVRVALVAAVVLAAAKLGTAIATGSLSVFASFLDSVMDIFSSSVNAVAIRIAARPADADHAYGHGKAESLAGLFQGAVIGCSSAALLVESVRRFWAPAAVAHEAFGIGVMAFAIVVTGFVVWRLRRALARADSLTLRAEWAHYAGDFVVNGAALAALAVQSGTAIRWLDPAVSALLSLWLVRAGWRIFRESVDVLMDREPAAGDVADQVAAALRPLAEVVGFHSLRARRSGTLKFVDLHLDLDRDLSFARAHALAEQAGRAIEVAIPGTTVFVHADPYPPTADEMDDPPTDQHLLRAPSPTPQ